MAQTTKVILTDDIDGSQASQTVTFGIDGVTYEIDLNDAHAAALRESLEEWSAKGRRVGGRRRRNSAPVNPGLTKKIREWALQQGLEVSERGRVSAQIREAYEQAHA